VTGEWTELNIQEDRNLYSLLYINTVMKPRWRAWVGQVACMMEIRKMCFEFMNARRRLENTFKIKCIVLWDITPCSPLKVNGHFRWNCHLLLPCLLPGLTLVFFLLIFRSWKQGLYVPPKLLLLFQRTTQLYPKRYYPSYAPLLEAPILHIKWCIWANEEVHEEFRCQGYSVL
jgi:hypothetical protein